MSRNLRFASQPGPFPLYLPFWHSVVFVDWHGVLCRDVFWFSILSNTKHPYHERLRDATSKLFQNSPDILSSWMRGQVSSDAIISSLEIKLDRRYGWDFLHRRLKADCRRMKAHPELLRQLQLVRKNSFVVLATDNMDCFVERLNVGKDLECGIDAVLCSSELGVLKTDGVTHFFGPWLKSHNLTFQDAILLDDNKALCQEFVAAGGSAIVVQDVETAIAELRNWKTSRAQTISR